MWLQILENIAIVLFMLSLFVAVLMIFCRSSTHFKGIDAREDKHFLYAFITRLYFVLTTVTTIGTGDVRPATMRARIVTMLIILVVFVAIIKTFDSIIHSYTTNFGSYVNQIASYNPFLQVATGPSSVK